MIVVAALLLANFAFRPLSLRWDLSKNKAYSLSPASKKILKGPTHEIKIKAIVSGNLPVRLQGIQKDALDLIGEHVQTNPSKLKLQKLDPDKDPKIAQEVETAGVPQLQFNQLGQNHFQTIKGYLGLIFESGEKKENLPTLSSPDTLEDD